MKIINMSSQVVKAINTIIEAIKFNFVIHFVLKSIKRLTKNQGINNIVDNEQNIDE